MNTVETVPQGNFRYSGNPDEAKPAFSASWIERICSVLSYITAFTYTGIFLFGDSHHNVSLAITAILIVLITELVHLGRHRSAESWIWLGCYAAAVVSVVFGISSVWDQDQMLLFIHIFAVWWIISRGGVLLDGKSGHLLPLDALNGFIAFPFRFFFLRIRTVFSVFSVIKSGISRPVKKRNLWGIAAVVVGAILFMEAASLLLSADSGFNDRFIILGELIDNCLDWISKCFDEKFIVRFIFSIPVGCWLFGLMSGSARVRPEELEHERSFVAASLIKIRKVPARVWTFVIGAFSLLYLSFFFLQGSYLFGAFTGTLPEGFIVSQYAREGFFELCRVISVNFSLLWFVTRTTCVGSERSSVFLVPCLVLLAESIVFAVIAFSKLFLYIRCFGFTPLRLQSTWLVCLCFAGCVLWIYQLLTGKPAFRKWMIFGAVTLSALCLV